MICSISMSQYKSTNKVEEANYEKEFHICQSYSLLKRKKIAHSTKKLYSSILNFYDVNGKETAFMVFKDKDIGFYEYWQVFYHNTKIDEDIETDDEQKELGIKFSISEIKEAINYIKINGKESFENLNKLKYLYNDNEVNEFINSFYDSIHNVFIF